MKDFIFGCLINPRSYIFYTVIINLTQRSLAVKFVKMSRVSSHQPKEFREERKVQELESSYIIRVSLFSLL